MRIAIIGSGNQASLHAVALAKLRDIEIVAIGSRQTSCRLAEKLRAPVRPPREVIADPQIEAVVIATPTATHAVLTRAALKAGKHVFCEVPIAHTLEEADAMIDAAMRAGLTLQIGMIHRFDAPYIDLIGRIRRGDLGAVEAIETTRLSAHLADGAQQTHHGDAIEELLTFDLHFLLWAFGMPRSVRAQTIDVGGRSRHVATLVEYPDLVATSTASSFLPSGFLFTEQTRVFAEKGHAELRLRLGPKTIEWTYEISRAKGQSEKILAPDGDPTVEQMRHFVDLSNGRARENLADAPAARQMLELTLAVARAARSGETVRFN